MRTSSRPRSSSGSGKPNYVTIACAHDNPPRLSVKIVVISDTHLPRFEGRVDAALRHVASERPQLILHCGDLTTLCAVTAFESIAPVEAVAGNNDGPEIVRRFGRRKIVEAGGLRIGLVHGDGSRGTTLGRAREAFARESVDAIAFGHSHIPYLERHGVVWVVNPGSVTDKRRQLRYSFAVLESDASGALAPRLVFFEPERQTPL
jgi:putative phosphoesterase